jgi:hypothetical protein
MPSETQAMVDGWVFGGVSPPERVRRRFHWQLATELATDN